MAKNGRVGKTSAYNRFVRARAREGGRFKKRSGALNMKAIGSAWRSKNKGASSRAKPRTSTKKGQTRKTSRRAYMPRKKASKSKSKKVKNVQLVSSAMALTLPWLIVDSADFNKIGHNASPEFATGKWSEGLKQTVDNLKIPAVQNKLIKFALGGILVKGAAKRLGMTGWKIGNVKVTPQ